MRNEYNIIWKTQSKNSGESMPCGGYDIGANVWVERDELYLYIDRSGYFDENNQMLKTGRYHFRFNPNPFRYKFYQELNLAEGCIYIVGDGGNIEVRMDTNSPLCIVHMQFIKQTEVTAIYENWRMADHIVSESERHAMASYVGYPKDVYIRKDQVYEKDNGIIFYHKNRNDKLLFELLLKKQNLEAVKNKFYNPQKDFIFGGIFWGKECFYSGVECGSYADVPYVGYCLKTEKCTKSEFRIAFHSGKYKTEQEFEKIILKKRKSDISYNDVVENAKKWWGRFWKKSYVHINDTKGENDIGFRIARNYTLFRYMMGCNSYGDYPTKFNGGLFTTDPWFSVGEQHRGKTPDFRMWGGGSFTAQNQRLLYWGMLASGDFELMPQQFNFYKRLLKNAELRTKEYWNHGGCSFAEQLENIGLPILWNWGFDETEDMHHKRSKNYDRTLIRGPWIRYEYSTQLEFSYMILEYYRYTGNDIAEYIPFIESCVKFYFEHYKRKAFESMCSEYDEAGKLVIFPSTALETYKNACNPIDAVAGLRAVVGRLIRLPQYVKIEYYVELWEHIPELPKTKDFLGNTILAPAEFWKGKINCEIPQLYPVFPYHFYGVGRDGLEIALHTWENIPEESDQRNHVSWHQDGIFTARMGLKEESLKQLILKMEDGGRRFPAFWGPGHDWVPDHNWGGSGFIMLHEMLVQEVDENIYLFPSWPVEWDVEFRLHLPKNTSLVVKKEGNKISYKLKGKKNYYIINCLEEKNETIRTNSESKTREGMLL